MKLEMNNYPLMCDFCHTKEFPSKRRIFFLDISEIKYYPHISEDGKDFSHQEINLKDKQICINCLSKLDLNNIILN